MENLLQLSVAPHSHNSAHIVCDIHFWRSQFKSLAAANLTHNQALCKIIGRTQSYVDSLVTITDTRCQDEENLIANLITVQNGLKYQAAKLKADAEIYQELERSLKQHKMKSHEQKLAQYNQQLKNCREKLDKQNQIIEEHKNAYHKVMLEMERGRIKSKLATKPDVVYRTEGKLNDLKAKADTLNLKYVKQLEKWQRQFKNVEKVSAEYEEAFTVLQSARADIVLSALRECVTQTDAGIIGDKDRIFKGIDGANIIRSKVLQKEDILAPKFEDFQPSGDTDEMYAQAKAEIETEDRCSYSSDDDVNVSDEEFKYELRMNRHMKAARKSRTYVVTQNYRRENIDELNLNIGDHVTKLLPANEKGMAYGEVTRNKMLHKKKKGFFPESHVGNIDEIQYPCSICPRDKLSGFEKEKATDEVEKKSWAMKVLFPGKSLKKSGKKDGKGTQIEVLPGAYRLMMENGLARDLQQGQFEFSRRTDTHVIDERKGQERPRDLIIEDIDIDNSVCEGVRKIGKRRGEKS